MHVYRRHGGAGKRRKADGVKKEVMKYLTTEKAESTCDEVLNDGEGREHVCEVVCVCL